MALLIGLSLQPEKPKLLADSSYEAINSDYHAGGAGCDPSQLRALPGPARQSKAEACDDTKEQHREAADGLIEARRSADAADAQAISANQQTGIAAWGTGMGVIIMIAAIAAGLFAERAAFHTKRSADIAHDSQRPWVAISCEIEKFTKLASGVSISVNIHFRNTGSIAALNYHASSSVETFEQSERNSVRDKLKVIWSKSRESKSKSDYVLVPTEIDTQHHLTTKTVGFSTEICRDDEQPYLIRQQASFCVMIVASAYYKISGSDDWRATERSFVVTVRRDPDFFPEEWIDGRFPNQTFPPEQISARQIFSGETS